MQDVQKGVNNQRCKQRSKQKCKQRCKQRCKQTRKNRRRVDTIQVQKGLRWREEGD